MPHKHKRKHDGDENSFDLPPTKVAKPLSAYEKVEKKHHKGPKPKPQASQPTKRKRDATSTTYKENDTPRAFARLMQLQQSGKKQRSGLDDGEASKAKKKRERKENAFTTTSNATDQAIQTQVEDAATKLKIQPGEKLADFAARVNQALPLSGLSQKGKHVEGMKETRTKTEKRLHRMYAEWRVADQKRKDREEEFAEEQQARDEELQTELGGQSIHLTSEGKKARRQRMITEAKQGDDDPWAVLKSKREAPKGLHDVVQAPPEMKVVPKEKFRVKNGAKVDVENVPGAAGSLKRREELGAARKEVIERYRAMMKGKSGL